jgi:hypothetical protein
MQVLHEHPLFSIPDISSLSLSLYTDYDTESEGDENASPVARKRGKVSLRNLEKYVANEPKSLRIPKKA